MSLRKTTQDNMRIPNWATPDRKELKRLLAGPTDAELERVIFGTASLQDTIWVDAADIEWDPERQGTFEDVLAEVQESPDSYDLDDPLIVDLYPGRGLVLNDGHHRFAKGVELEGEERFQAYVQIPRGLAREIFEELKREGK